MESVNDVAVKAHAEHQQEPHQLIDLMTEAVGQFVGGAEQSDDLTMMAIQYIKKQNSIVLPNDTQEVPRLNTFVSDMCNSLDAPLDVTAQVQLAVEEAVVNVMDYAYPAGTRGELTVEVQADDEQLQFVIRDTGIPFDPTTTPEIDTTLSAKDRPIGGLGIHLVRQIMDDVQYRRIGEFNVLTLIKKYQKVKK